METRKRLRTEEEVVVVEGAGGGVVVMMKDGPCTAGAASAA